MGTAPTPGGPGQLPSAGVQWWASRSDPCCKPPPPAPVRALWTIRWKAGERCSAACRTARTAGPGSEAADAFARRLSADLRGAAAPTADFAATPLHLAIPDRRQSGPRRSSTGLFTGSCTLAGFQTGPAATAQPDGHPRQAKRAVPGPATWPRSGRSGLPDRVPADAAGRSGRGWQALPRRSGTGARRSNSGWSIPRSRIGNPVPPDRTGAPPVLEAMNQDTAIGLLRRALDLPITALSTSPVERKRPT